MTPLSPEQRRRNRITGIVLALVAVGFMVSVWLGKLSHLMK
jgi:predicted tellurium resistance membrane protein TerC